MLTITAAQVDALKETAVERHVADLAAHLQTYFPNHLAAAGDPEAARATGREAVRRARALGCANTRATTCLVTIFAMAGAGFDREPLAPELGAALDEPDLEPGERVALAMRRAVKRQTLIAGEGNRALNRAVLTLQRDFAALTAPTESAGEIAGRLAALWPDAASAAPDGAVAAVAGAALEDAPALGMAAAEGAPALATARFLLGAGVVGDPLRPWAARALAESDGADPQATAAAFREAAKRYMDAFLAAGRAEAPV